MGVKTPLTLREANKLFGSYKFKTIIPTSSGIIDTTYIVSTDENSYILKKYERDIKDEIEQDKKLLNNLNSLGLNVPVCLGENGVWFLYKKLQGVEPKQIYTYHIQALGEFLAKLHSHTYKKNCPSKFLQNYKIPKLLNFTKSNFFFYYKKLQFLNNYKMQEDGLIHGDIFKDNTVFNEQKIGVFDFIDSACGDFSFDCAVGLIGFGITKDRTFFINLFLNRYNRYSPKKISKKELLQKMEVACGFYALLRINKYKNTKKAKELI